ncbi:hypothetical protein ED733_004014 [Metarhizium rileyi]|uniref:Protein-arginine deiminase C-terminal domain-containing protein n=1 Tax=Metarhizium rileyi (strain RCEF 4871) TaxID=1649241 RepID=A0A5C6G8N4_METRR|nr:hypothetical protein ED733_004014 [Metarhizium rileyi]
MHSLGKAAVLALGLATAGYALEAVILADTNRDGKIDVHSDTEGKQAWTEERGALFLPNIADTDRRCSKTITVQTPDTDLDKCHDASDSILRNSKFLAPIKTLPNPGLTDGAQGLIAVSGDFANEKVRIFHKSGNAWTYVDDGRVFQADELRAGLELGIDARDVRRPNEWNGKVKVHFSLTDNGESATDQVELRVAPVLIHHTLQELTEVFVGILPRDYPGTKEFVQFVERYSAEAGNNTPVTRFDIQDDLWVQDVFETGYTSIPGPEGPVILRLMIRSSQLQGLAGRRVNGRRVFSQLRSETVGAIQYLPEKHDRPWTIDSLGNLETVPPHSHNGKNYPNGRALMGSQKNRKPHMVEFLEAQEAQQPIELDTNWLKVGHTDEFMQFLPADNARGWVMVVDDPQAALDLFKEANESGHGRTLAMSRPHMPYDYEYSCLPSNTVEGLLGNRDFRETGITDDEIIRIPAFYYTYNKLWNCARRNYYRKRDGTEGLPELMKAFGSEDEEDQLKRRAADNQVVPFHPAIINGVVYNNGKYLAPNPWGPVINGSDILAAAASEAYRKVGFEVTYMDDWFDHHQRVGDTHCGTNVARDASKKWW